MGTAGSQGRFLGGAKTIPLGSPSDASRISSMAMRWQADSTHLLALQSACRPKPARLGDGAVVLATSGFVYFSSTAHSATLRKTTAARQSLSSFVKRCRLPSTTSIERKRRPSYRTSK